MLLPLTNVTSTQLNTLYSLSINEGERRLVIYVVSYLPGKPPCVMGPTQHRHPNKDSIIIRPLIIAGGAFSSHCEQSVLIQTKAIWLSETKRVDELVGKQKEMKKNEKKKKK